MAHDRRRVVEGRDEAFALAVTWSEQTGKRYRIRQVAPGQWLVQRSQNGFPNVCPVCKRRHTYRPRVRALA